MLAFLHFINKGDVIITSFQYYYEPGSGRQFRSLISVKRYLSGEEHIEIPRKKPSNSLVVSCVENLNNLSVLHYCLLTVSVTAFLLALSELWFLQENRLWGEGK